MLINRNIIGAGGEFSRAGGGAEDEDEDALLQRALEMSMMLSMNEAGGAGGAGQESKQGGAEEDVSVCR